MTMGVGRIRGHFRKIEVEKRQKILKGQLFWNNFLLLKGLLLWNGGSTM